MTTAVDLMIEPAPSVQLDTSVSTVVRKLLREDLDGVCVVDNGQLRGVITLVDVLYQEKSFYSPAYLPFMDVQIPIGGQLRFEKQRRKSLAQRAHELMSRQVISVETDTPSEELADLLIDKHLTILPVLLHGQLVGMVTRKSLLRHMVGSRLSAMTTVPGHIERYDLPEWP